MRKSDAAFRTISEVSQDIDVPQHVLRFWESRFTQIKPLKRGGGRRYYRPEDVALLRRIRDLLYREGYTIKGVQKLLRDSNGRLDGLPPEPPDPAADPASETVVEAQPPPAQPIIAEAVPAAAEKTRGELERLLAELVEMRDLLNQAAR